MAKGQDGLTQKQMAFCKAIAQGKSGVEAYEKAYSTNASRKTMAEKASRLLKQDNIRATVERLQRQSMAAQIRKGLGQQDQIRERLWYFAENATPQDSNRIRALELLGKSAGMFTDHKVIETRESAMTSDDIREALRAKLMSLRQDGDL